MGIHDKRTNTSVNSCLHAHSLTIVREMCFVYEMHVYAHFAAPQTRFILNLHFIVHLVVYSGKALWSLSPSFHKFMSRSGKISLVSNTHQILFLNL